MLPSWLEMRFSHCVTVIPQSIKVSRGWRALLQPGYSWWLVVNAILGWKLSDSLGWITFSSVLLLKWKGLPPPPPPAFLNIVLFFLTFLFGPFPFFSPSSPSQSHLVSGSRNTTNTHLNLYNWMAASVFTPWGLQFLQWLPKWVTHFCYNKM